MSTLDPEVYPAAPSAVPEDLTAPSSGYKRLVAAAVAGIALFFIFYFALAGWFGLVAYRTVRNVSNQPAHLFLIGIPTAFLCLILVKALFSRQKTPLDGLVEVQAGEHPKFVAFVHRVADETGAPRPKKIYLSADVNAAVFLDVGLLNLLRPTRKNLIVGLGLINGLSLDEFKAVIAHEFGHFAQRSMGIGSWVYLAQRFVAELVGRRDIVDRFIQGLSRFDFRIAWIGWALRILVWALRAVVDQFFRFVFLLGRALSRQMEFQADLVSVSVSGSDSLVHALSRLGAMDRAWGSAASFVAGAARRDQHTEDMFAVQTRFIERYREVHALPHHGKTPTLPTGIGRAAHRVFEGNIADAPRMWSSHPSNKDREANCKKRYVASKLDARSAWAVFADPDAVRRQVTGHFIALTLKGPAGLTPEDSAADLPMPKNHVPLAESLGRIDEIFGRPALDRRYEGLYTTATLTRAIPNESALAIAPAPDLSAESLLAEFDAVFEPALAAEVETYFDLDEELRNLNGLEKGFLKAPGGLIVHRGEQLRRNDLPAAVSAVKAEFEAHRKGLAERFRRARGISVRAAQILDKQQSEDTQDTSWESHITQLTELLNYAEHTSAQLADVVGYFDHVLTIVFADGNVSKAEMRRLEAVGERVARALRAVFEARTAVRLCEPLRQRLSKDALSWEDILGKELHLHAPTRNDFANQWIEAAASWWGPYLSALDSLMTHTLDVLIEAEEYVLNKLRSGGDVRPAPIAASVPSQYTRLPFGEEIERQHQLGLWDRFQTAQGWVGSTMRFVVASAVLAPAFVGGFLTSHADLIVYNGLGTDVVVQIGEDSLALGPDMHATMTVALEGTRIRTTTAEGELIEQFLLEDQNGAHDPIYNVANAAGFVRWWATYGTTAEREPEFIDGRVLEGDSDYIFREAPERISTSHSRGERRSVLMALTHPLQLMSVWPAHAATMAIVHLRHDSVQSAGLGMWMHAVPEADRQARVLALYARIPSARTLALRRRYVNSAEQLEFCRTALARPDPGGQDLLEATYCAHDDRIYEAAANTSDEWVQLLAAEQETIEHRYEEALMRYRRLTLADTEAALTHRQAILLRLAGRAAESHDLPSDGSYYDWLRAVETRAPGAEVSAGLIWARQDGDFNEANLNEARSLDSIDELAFSVASPGAPPDWYGVLASSSAPFDGVTGAATAWALAVQHDDQALQQRASAAFADRGGSFELANLDVESLRETPAVLLEGEHHWTLSSQASARLIGLLLLGPDAPIEWTAFVKASTPVLNRPCLE